MAEPQKKKKIFKEQTMKIIEENDFDLDLNFDENGDVSFKLTGVGKPLGKKCSHVAKDLQDLVGGLEDTEIPTQEFFEKPEEVPQALIPDQPMGLASRPKVTGFNVPLPAPTPQKEDKPKVKGKRRQKEFE